MARRPKPVAVECDCGSGQPYPRCCGAVHAGTPAPDAAALMRSRYSAYVRGLTDYLLASWHHSTRPPELVLDTGTQWLGLRVLEHIAHDEDHAEVEFIARYRVGGASAQRMHERSRFVREAGRWYYVDGDFPRETAHRR